MLGMFPPDPLGVSPPFPMSRLTRSRFELGGIEKFGGGCVNVASFSQKSIGRNHNFSPKALFIDVNGRQTKPYNFVSVAR